MSTRAIKLFGERNTATRAVLRMLDDTPGLQNAAASAEHLRDDAEMRKEIEAIAGKMERPWRKIYREAVKDRTFASLPPVQAWKHSAAIYDPAYANDSVSVLFTVRNPYSWIVALYRNPYHIMGDVPATIGQFVAQPWLTVARDQIDPLLTSPVELWNRKLKSYLDFMALAKADAVPATTLKFEDFVSDPPGSFSAAMAALGIACVAPVYNPEPTKKRGFSLRKRQSFYEKADWAKEMTKDEIAAITEKVDWDTAEKFGYRRGNLTD